MSEAVTVKGTENEGFYKHQPSVVLGLIAGDIAWMTKLNRMYVAVCTISCLSVLGLALARMFLLK